MKLILLSSAVLLAALPSPSRVEAFAASSRTRSHYSHSPPPHHVPPSRGRSRTTSLVGFAAEDVAEGSSSDPATAKSDSSNKKPGSYTSIKLPGFQSCPPGMVVAYQGEPGAYSEAATLTAYPDCIPLPCAVFEDAYEAGESKRADRVVLPFENSLGGSIHKNYDLMLVNGLHIVGEVNFRVRHCLLALPGTRVEDVTRVLSHPQALAQCDKYLTNLNGGTVVKENRDDTAGSAKLIRDEKLENAAAVASERAAQLYGMAVLDRDIQDDPSNLTRFLALARDPLPPVRVPGLSYKTSIVFAFKDGPGRLFKSLACFALRDINLTKIESRPLKEEPLAEGLDTGVGGGGPVQFQYLFYVDCEASLADEALQNALRNLEEHTLFLRVLGSYPRHIFT